MGTTECIEICKYDLNDPEEVKKYFADEEALKRCQKCMAEALRIINDMIENGKING